MLRTIITSNPQFRLFTESDAIYEVDQNSKASDIINSYENILIQLNNHEIDKNIEKFSEILSTLQQIQHRDDYFIKKIFYIFNYLEKNENALKKCSDLIDAINNIIRECPKGIINQLEEKIDYFTIRLQSPSINFIMYREIVSQYLEYNIQTCFFKKIPQLNQRNQQHLETNVFLFLQKHNLISQNIIRNDTKSINDEYDLNLYFYLMVSYSSPSQQLNFLTEDFKTFIVYSKPEKDEIINFNHLDIEKLNLIRNTYFEKVKNYINDENFAKLMVGYNNWIIDHIYLVRENKQVKISIETFKNVYLETTDGNYYVYEKNDVIDEKQWFYPYFSEKMIIFIEDIKQVSKLYLQKFCLKKNAFIVSVNECFFDPYLYEAPLIPSIENLMNLPAKIACFNPYDEIKIELSKKEETENALAIAWCKTDQRFSKSFQIKKLIHVCKLIFFKVNNKKISFDDNEIKDFEELNFNELLNLSNFLIFVYEMANASSINFQNKIIERFYCSDINHDLYLFESKKTFLFFLRCLKENKTRFNIEFLIIFSQYLIIMDKPMMENNFQKLDSIFRHLNNHSIFKIAAFKRMVFQIINGGEFSYGETFLLEKFIVFLNLNLNNGNESKTYNIVKDIADSFYLNHLNCRQTAFFLKSDKIFYLQRLLFMYLKLSGKKIDNQKFDEKNFYMIKQNNQLNFEKKIGLLGMEKWKNIMIHSVLGIEITLFRKFLVTLLFFSILSQLFVSSLLALFLFELSLGLIIINFMDLLFTTKYHIACVLHDNSRVKLPLSKSDYLLFTNKANQEQFFCIDYGLDIKEVQDIERYTDDSSIPKNQK